METKPETGKAPSAEELIEQGRQQEREESAKREEAMGKLIAEKMAVGLTREQARAVVEQQFAEEAAAEAARKSAKRK